MGRLGILPFETQHFIEKLTRLKGIEIEGILSHLADTNQENHSGPEFTRRQVELFNQQIEELSQMGIDPRYRHLANSAASIDELPDSFNLVRPGIMLYGSYPAQRFQQRIDLKPVMNLTTKIISLKKVPQGTSISYGRTFTCKRESLIATLPIGYADGYSRSLSNRGEVLVREKSPCCRCSLHGFGNDDVTDIPGVALGDEVILMGSQGSEVITAEDVAEKMSTISYEFLCGIGPRDTRIYTKGGKILKHRLPFLDVTEMILILISGPIEISNYKQSRIFQYPTGESSCLETFSMLLALSA